MLSTEAGPWKYDQAPTGRGPGSVVGIATGWTVRGSNPGGGEIFRTCPDRPWGSRSLLYNGYQVFPGSKEWLGRDAGPSPPSSAVVKERVELLPLLPLWAVRPVQSLGACTRVTFTFTFFLPTEQSSHDNAISILSKQTGLTNDEQQVQFHAVRCQCH